MRISKSALVKGALVAVMAAGTMVTSFASAATATTSYVVCNRWDECWKVHEKYTTYPADERIVWHDDAWYEKHQKDAHWHMLSDPADDHGFYDKDGAWHAFTIVTPAP